MGDGETLHYQSVVPDAGTDGDAAAEGFFDLANARCVRYTVAVGEREAREGRGGGEQGDGETNEASGSSRADEVELVVEQDQSLHDSCGGIVWESAYALEQYMRLNIGRICARCSAACTARGRTRIPTRSHRTSRAGSGPVPPPAQPRPRAMSRSPRSSRRRPARRRPVLLAPRALPPRRCIARIGRWRGRRSPRRRRLHPCPRRGRRSDSGASPRRPSVGAQTPRARGFAGANESPGQTSQNADCRTAAEIQKVRDSRAASPLRVAGR